MPVPVTELSTMSLSDFTSLTEQKFLEWPDMVDDYAMVSSLFVPVDVPKNTGKTKIFNEIDTETFASLKLEGADARKKRVVMGYSKTMTKRRFAAEIDITYEMREENRYPEVTTKLTDLSQFCPQRMMLDLVHRISFATATSYTDMDGETVDTTVGDTLALVSSAHTLTTTTTTFSNVITGNPQFSKGGFQIAKERANSQIMTHFGERRIFNFDAVVTTDDPSVLDEVAILKNSTTDPTQNNSGVINSYKGGFKHVVLHYLDSTATGAKDSTKSKYWAYVATSGAPGARWQAYFGIWEAPRLKTPVVEDEHNDNWTYGARCGYGIATVSPRGFLLSTGLGI